MAHELTNEERDTLCELVENHLRDLSFEVANTDTKDYRDRLKRRRDVLQSALQYLQGSHRESLADKEPPQPRI